MTAFKPATVAASGVLAITSKLFPTEAYNNMITIMLDDKIVSQGPVSECTQEMEKWTDGLGCTPLGTVLVRIPGGYYDDAIDDDDVVMMDFELNWGMGVSDEPPVADYAEMFLELLRADVVGVSDEPRDVDCLGNLKKAIIGCFGLNKQE